MPDEYHHGVRVIEKDDGSRPIRTIETGLIGVVGTAPDADETVFPLNEPVLIAGSRTKAAKLDTEGNGQGTLPAVMDAIFDQIAPLMVVVRVEGSEDAATEQSNLIGTVDAAGRYTGLQALLATQSQLGVKPRILGCPGFSHRPAVATELAAIAEKLKGFAYADVSATTADAAVTYRAQFGHQRLMLIWPGFTVFDVSSARYVNQPASARALGLRAKLDHDIGWHKTLSNIPINGVAGLTADVDWDLQNPATKAGYLNTHEVTTLINHQGFRFWGSRTCSSDPKFAFESAVRTGDVLAETIARSHLWAVDKPMSNTLIEDLMEGVNARFRELKAQGAIVGAECTLDPELNSQSALQAGKLWLNYDYTPVPPLEQLGFQARITNRYLVELLPTRPAA